MIANGSYFRIAFISLIGIFQASSLFSYSDFNSLYDSAKTYKSVELATQALELAQKEENNVQLAKSHFLLAYYFEDLFMYYESINHYFSALEYYEKTHNVTKQIGTLRNIGMLYSVGGFYEEAIKFFNEAVSLAQKIQDTPRELLLHYQVARAHQLSESYPEAERIYYWLIPQLEVLKDELLVSRCYLSLGFIAAMKGESYDSADYYYTKAIEAFSSESKQKDLARLKKMNSLAFLHIQNESFKQAKTWLLSALDQSNNDHLHKEVLINIYENLGDLYKATKVVDSTVIMYEKAIELRNLKEFKQDFLVMCNYLYRHYRSENSSEADYYHELIYEFATELAELKRNLQEANSKYQIIAAHHLHKNNIISSESKTLQIIVVIVGLIIGIGIVFYLYMERKKANKRAYRIRETLKDAALGREVIVP